MTKKAIVLLLMDRKRATCKMCRKVLKGRSDQIYCSVKCKSDYHHRLRQATNEASLQIDAYLHRNRSILLEIMGKVAVKKKVLRSVLEAKHFKFNFITHFYINSRGKTMYYVYDFGWMTFSEEEILIVRILPKI